MPISIHAIRAAVVTGLPYAEIEIDGWGLVRIQKLKPYEREAFAAQLSGRSTDLLSLVVACAVDDCGAPLFVTPADIALLAEKAGAVATLGAAAVALHKTTQPAQLEALVPPVALHK